ncbi:MAG: sulfatase [Planctomycetota bacterium]|nr:MAG: sulfatase [Planctomycetota bacterium]
MIRNRCGMFLLLSAACLWAGFAAAEQRRPNIVWLTSEDNSAVWYRLYNPKGAPMPNIERLAEHGLVFNNAYSNAPVCSVARSTLISGCYAPRLGVQWHRKEQPVKMPPGLHMFPWYLRQIGYYTTNNAKEDYNFLPEEKEGVWDESSNKATYRNRKPGQPFFHVQNFGRTHEGQLFRNRPDESLKTNPDDVEVFPYHPDTPLFRNKYADYLDAQTEVDAQIGEFIRQLEADGLLDDTFIFHFGDNGGVLPGSKGYANEDGLHVGLVVYVPKNFRHLVPAEPGSRIDGFVEFIDLSATVLNLAGATIPEGIDGRPFLGPGVTLEELNRRNTTYGYAERFDEKYDLVRFFRKGKYSYHRSYQPFNFDGLYNEYRYKQPAYREWLALYRQGKLNAAQAAFFEARPPECLYDLENDPHEVHNLADDPAYADVLADMRREVQRRMRNLPDLGMIPEPVFLREGAPDGFGYARANKDRIARLLAIADLELVPFDEAKPKLEAAFADDDPLARYWAWIVCSSFGEQATCFVDKARKAMWDDDDLLVRTRAAEFVGLVGAGDPRPALVDILNKTTDPVEANLILNTVVLLQDGKTNLPFDFAQVANAPWVKSSGEVARRIRYLKGTTD